MQDLGLRNDAMITTTDKMDPGELLWMLLTDQNWDGALEKRLFHNSMALVTLPPFPLS